MKNGWITTLKVFSWIVFGLIIVVGFACLAMTMLIAHAAPSGQAEGQSILTGLGMLLGFIILAIIFLSVSMVFLNLAQDVSDIKAILKKRQY